MTFFSLYTSVQGQHVTYVIMKTHKCSTLSQKRLQLCFGNGSTCLTDRDPILPLQGRLLPSDLFCSWTWPLLLLNLSFRSDWLCSVLGFVPAGSPLKSIRSRMWYVHRPIPDKNITYWCCWTQYACSMYTDLSQRRALFTCAARLNTRVVCTQTYPREEHYLLVLLDLMHV